MGFIDIPTEQTTAFTDVMLCVASIALAVVISRAGHPKDEGRSRYWTILFLLLGFAAGTGAVAHGIEMSERTNRFVWLPLNLALGLTISFFVVIVILELWGADKAKKALSMLLGVGVVFFIITAVIPGIFLLFIIYEGIAMIFAFGSFVYLTRKTGDRHYKLITGIISTGIFLSIVAAVVQTIEPLEITIIWEFDHNSFFHIIQIIAMFVLTFGVVGQLGKLQRSG